MDERLRRVKQIEQRIQMLLGIFASHGVLPLEFKPAYSVGTSSCNIWMSSSRRGRRKGASSHCSPITSPRSIRSLYPLRCEARSGLARTDQKARTQKRLYNPEEVAFLRSMSRTSV